MGKPVKHVAVTGGAGQIAYSLLFRIANGEMLGADQPVALHILEIPQALDALKGVQMELEDCAFPLLTEVHVTDNPTEAFSGADYALLVGSKPREKGMERSDLLQANGQIFIGQGKALDEAASKNVKVLVVGNPCNTNCLITMNNAPSIPRKNFLAMTFLDHNRAKSLMAGKAGVPVSAVTNMTIWGNHSATQVPDFVNTRINGAAASEVITDSAWLEQQFIPEVQQRGAAIIKARGKSSAASAANAAIDSIKALHTPTPKGDWFSMAVCSDGNPYGVPDDLVYSFPCRSNGDGDYEIVPNVPWTDFLKPRLEATAEELIAERDAVTGLIK